MSRNEGKPISPSHSSESIAARLTTFVDTYLLHNPFDDLFHKPSHDHEPLFEITEEDIWGEPEEPLFLGTYSLDELEASLTKYNVRAGLAKKGYNNLIVTIDTKDHFVHKVTITDKKLLEAKLPENAKFLLNIFVRRKQFVVSDFRGYQLMRRIEMGHEMTKKKVKYLNETEAGEIWRFLEKEIRGRGVGSWIEWMCMQDPLQSFPKNLPQLPGQSYRGLGLGKEVGNMLNSLAKEKGRDALFNVPEYFHNAIIYRKQGQKFLNPAFQGYFEGLIDSLEVDIKTHGLSAVSWAFCNGHVRNAAGELELWVPEDQCYPISKKLTTYFQSEGYLNLCNKYRTRGYTVWIDWEECTEIWRYSMSAEYRERFDKDEEENQLAQIGHL